MSEDLTFSIMIDSDLGEEELMSIILKNLASSKQVGGYIKYEGNILKFEKNSLHDRMKALERNEKSWMYYKYSLSVFPDSNVILDGQRAIAFRIMRVLDEAGTNPELVSEFEL